MQIVPQSRLYPAVVSLPPQVSLNTTQSAIQSVSQSSVPLTASAVDPDGTIAKVVFTANGLDVGTSTSSPFQSQWTSVRPGTYQVTATAYDNSGAATVSDPVTLTFGAQVRVQGMIQLKRKHPPVKAKKPVKAKNKAVVKKAVVKKAVVKKPAAKKPAAKKPLH